MKDETSAALAAGINDLTAEYRGLCADAREDYSRVGSALTYTINAILDTVDHYEMSAGLEAQLLGVARDALSRAKKNERTL